MPMMNYTPRTPNGKYNRETVFAMISTYEGPGVDINRIDEVVQFLSGGVYQDKAHGFQRLIDLITTALMLGHDVRVWTVNGQDAKRRFEETINLYPAHLIGNLDYEDDLFDAWFRASREEYSWCAGQTEIFMNNEDEWLGAWLGVIDYLFQDVIDIDPRLFRMETPYLPLDVLAEIYKTFK